MLQINEWLESYTNIIGVAGVVISLFALFIAIWAYRAATLKADLYLRYISYDWQKGMGVNGNLPLDLAAENENACVTVTSCRPGNEVTWMIENKGKVAATRPVIDFEFEKVVIPFSQPREEWATATTSRSNSPAPNCRRLKRKQNSSR